MRVTGNAAGITTDRPNSKMDSSFYLIEIVFSLLVPNKFVKKFVLRQFITKPPKT